MNISTSLCDACWLRTAQCEQAAGQVCLTTSYLHWDQQFESLNVPHMPVKVSDLCKIRCTGLWWVAVHQAPLYPRIWLPTSFETELLPNIQPAIKDYLFIYIAVQSLDVEKIECAFNELLPLHGIKVDEYLTLTQLDEVIHKLYRCCDSPLSQPVWTSAMASCLLYFFDGWVGLTPAPLALV